MNHKNEKLQLFHWHHFSCKWGRKSNGKHLGLVNGSKESHTFTVIALSCSETHTICWTNKMSYKWNGSH